MGDAGGKSNPHPPGCSRRTAPANGVISSWAYPNRSRLFVSGTRDRSSVDGVGNERLATPSCPIGPCRSDGLQSNHRHSAVPEPELEHHTRRKGSYARPWKTNRLERVRRIELHVSSLASWRSTTELHPRYHTLRTSYKFLEQAEGIAPSRRCIILQYRGRAGDQNRTGILRVETSCLTARRHPRSFLPTPPRSFGVAIRAHQVAFLQFCLDLLHRPTSTLNSRNVAELFHAGSMIKLELI